MTIHSELDKVDLGILRIIQVDSSVSNVEIGRQVGVSPPTVHARIKRMTQLGYIREYVAHLNPRKLGHDLRCMIQINLQTHSVKDVYSFRDEITKMPEVLVAYQITGEFDYMLVVIARNQEDLSHFLMEKLTPFECIDKIQTSIVLDVLKDSTVVPIED